MANTCYDGFFINKFLREGKKFMIYGAIDLATNESVTIKFPKENITHEHYLQEINTLKRLKEYNKSVNSQVFPELIKSTNSYIVMTRNSPAVDDILYMNGMKTFHIFTLKTIIRNVAYQLNILHDTLKFSHGRILPTHILQVRSESQKYADIFEMQTQLIQNRLSHRHSVLSLATKKYKLIEQTYVPLIPPTVILSEKYTLCGFGNVNSTESCPIPFTAPEEISNTEHKSTSTDIWNFGIVMLQLGITGTYDLENAEEVLYFAERLQGTYLTKENFEKFITDEGLKSKYVETNGYYSIGPNTPDNIKEKCNMIIYRILQYDAIIPVEFFDLLGKIFNVNPEKRITAKDILLHPFVN